MPLHPEVYYSLPSSLEKLHDIVTTNQSSQRSVTFLAWTYVISRLTLHAEAYSDLPNSFFLVHWFPNRSLSRPYSKEGEPLHVQMVKACLACEYGLLKLLEHLLTQSPRSRIQTSLPTDVR